MHSEVEGWFKKAKVEDILTHESELHFWQLQFYIICMSKFEYNFVVQILYYVSSYFETVLLCYII